MKHWREAEARLTEIEAIGKAEELAAAIVSMLSDQPRSGAPVTFTAEQVCQILAVACEAPAESKRPVAEWTPREPAEEVVQRGIVSRISGRKMIRPANGAFFKAPGI